MAKYLPVLYRWLCIGAAIGVLIAYGWVMGARHAELQSTRFEAIAETLGKVQADRAKRLTAKLKDITDEASKNHEASVAGIRRAYAAGWMPGISPDRRAVPAVPGNPQVTGPRPADDGSAAALRETQERCAVTTQMFIDLRDAWREVGRVEE